MHMDFQRIVEDEEIKMLVPIHFIGEDVAPGVKLGGGSVSHLTTEVEVVCLPKHLPEYLEIEVSELELDEMLKMSDIVVITKGDIVSQAEREVFASRVNSVNPKATIMHVNGLTGQGAFELGTLLYDEKEIVETVKGKQLRFPMPSALCSYCLGETRIGEEFQMGNVRKINLEKPNE